MNKSEPNKYSGQLFHDGHPQGPRFNGTREEIRDQAQTFANTLKINLGDEYKRLYPNGMELRIWD